MGAETRGSGRVSGGGERVPRFGLDSYEPRDEKHWKHSRLSGQKNRTSTGRDGNVSFYSSGTAWTSPTPSFMGHVV